MVKLVSEGYVKGLYVYLDFFNFKNYWDLDTEVSIDEQMLGFKGSNGNKYQI